jgi:hypothetical protein
VKEVAEFIMNHGKTEDVAVTTEQGEPFLDTFGIYINKISDMDYRYELLKVLIPMQQEYENAVFSGVDEEEEMAETDEMDISM